MTTGGVVDPDRLRGVGEFRFGATVEIQADGETWTVRSSDEAPVAEAARAPGAAAVAGRPLTVRVEPGPNVRRTPRALVSRLPALVRH
uniref:DUF7285 family protein n=1 Tax=Halorubrum lacusprofundi TaxID=2247 RepID=UPI001F5B7A86|nr:hypothetical protein [Halorubrum lacusprofundi]